MNQQTKMQPIRNIGQVEKELLPQAHLSIFEKAEIVCPAALRDDVQFWQQKHLKEHARYAETVDARARQAQMGRAPPTGGSTNTARAPAPQPTPAKPALTPVVPILHKDANIGMNINHPDFVRRLTPSLKRVKRAPITARAARAGFGDDVSSPTTALMVASA